MYCIGIDLGGTNIAVGVVNDRYEIVARRSVPTGAERPAEEVIREDGYGHIVPTFLKSAQVTTGGLTRDQRQQAKLKREMCAQGFYEAITLAFYSDAELDGLQLPEDAPERNVIRLLNPLSSNLTIMRPLLAPSLLNVVVENLKKGNGAGRIFELANVYLPKEQPLKQLPEETLHLGFAAFGDNESFFTVKGAVEALGSAFGLQFDYTRAEDVSWLHPGIAAYIYCQEQCVGVFGKLANGVSAELKLPKDSKSNHKIFLGEIDYPRLAALMPEGLRYRPLSQFPTVTRDLALVVDEEMTCGALTAEIRNACRQVCGVELFDIYRGAQLGEGKKSMAFKIAFAPEDKALTPEELDRFMKKILGNLKFRLGAEIR